MTLRFRLTLVSTIVVMVVLASFGGGVYLLLNKALHDNLDAQLARHVPTVARDFPFSEGRADYIAQVVSSAGTVTPIGPYQSAVLSTDDSDVRAIATGASRKAVFKDITIGRVEARLVIAPGLISGTPVAIMVAAPRGTISETLRRLRNLLAWAGLIGIALAAALAWQSARTALRPVEEVSAAAAEIGRTADLSRRVHAAGTDELGQLTVAFNGMLDRVEHAQTTLERSLEGQKRFLADASHELRTPLTTMRGNLEVLRSSPDMPAKDRADALHDSIEEAERMSVLVEDLLALARADAQAPRHDEPVELARITREAIASAAGADEAAGGDGPNVRMDVASNVLVHGSADQLRRLATNLVDNAIKYTPAEGHIDVTVAVDGDWAVMRVRDDGVGMSPEELVHAFDRFWRSDRSRGERGSGLGLAIAKSVVHEHGGTIDAESVPGEGTLMTVRLPLLRPDSKHQGEKPQGERQDQKGQGEIATGLREGDAHNGST